jgi:CHASE2 domain-containing sensor protein
MSDLSPRPRSNLSRSARRDRAYNLTVVGGGASVVAVAGVVLAAIGIVGAWLPIIAILVAVACFVMFRRTIAGR